jgi:hypothetical protein
LGLSGNQVVLLTVFERLWLLYDDIINEKPI